jgi:flagellar protein FliO/FliZ
VLWGLLIVIGLMLVLYALARKRFSLLGVGGSGKIKVLEMRPLMARTALALVEVEGEKLLIGIGNGTVRMLTHLPAGKDEQNTTSPESHCFADHLDREQQS